MFIACLHVVLFRWKWASWKGGDFYIRVMLNKFVLNLNHEWDRKHECIWMCAAIIWAGERIIPKPDYVTTMTAWYTYIYSALATDFIPWEWNWPPPIIWGNYLISAVVFYCGISYALVVYSAELATTAKMYWCIYCSTKVYFSYWYPPIILRQCSDKSLTENDLVLTVFIIY